MPSLFKSIRKNVLHRSNDNRAGTDTARTSNAFEALGVEDAADEPQQQACPTPEPPNQPEAARITEQLSNITITEESSSDNETVEDGYQTQRRNRRYRHTTTTIGPDGIPDGNWNTHRGANAGAQSIRTTRTRRYGASSRRTTYVRGLRTRSGVGFAEQNPGVIVWHWDHRVIHNHGNTSESDPIRKFLIQGPDGGWWIKKGRYWIIVSRTRYTVTEIPLYTYDDEGLKNKINEIKWEYLSVKPIRTTNGRLFSNQNPDNPVLEIASMKREEEEMRATMVARFTEPFTRDVDVDDLRYVGNLSFQAAMTLVEKVKGNIGHHPEGDRQVVCCTQTVTIASQMRRLNVALVAHGWKCEHHVDSLSGANETSR